MEKRVGGDGVKGDDRQEDCAESGAGLEGRDSEGGGMWLKMGVGSPVGSKSKGEDGAESGRPSYGESR